MNQPQIHTAVCVDKCRAQRFALFLMDETSYDANISDIHIRISFAEEYVRMARRVSMNNEVCTMHLGTNAVDQLCGLLRWQAINTIADFHKSHRVHFDPLKSLLNPTRNGSESPCAIVPAGLLCVQADV